MVPGSGLNDCGRATGSSWSTTGGSALSSTPAMRRGSPLPPSRPRLDLTIAMSASRASRTAAYATGSRACAAYRDWSTAIKTVLPAPLRRTKIVCRIPASVYSIRAALSVNAGSVTRSQPPLRASVW